MNFLNISSFNGSVDTVDDVLNVVLWLVSESQNSKIDWVHHQQAENENFWENIDYYVSEGFIREKTELNVAPNRIFQEAATVTICMNWRGRMSRNELRYEAIKSWCFNVTWMFTVPLDVGKELTKENDCSPEFENLPERLWWSGFVQQGPAENHEWIDDGDQSCVLICAVDHHYENDVSDLGNTQVEEGLEESLKHCKWASKFPCSGHLLQLQFGVFR